MSGSHPGASAGKQEATDQTAVDLKKIVIDWVRSQSKAASPEWCTLDKNDQELPARLSESKVEADDDIVSIELAEPFYDTEKIDRGEPPASHQQRRLTNILTNDSDSDTPQSINFSETVSVTDTHALTVGVNFGFALSATSGFVGAKLSTGLKLSSTETVSGTRSFTVAPTTTVNVKAKHKATVEGELTPIPEKHPFTMQVSISGKVPVLFKNRMMYKPGRSAHKIFKDRDGKKLLYIPIEDIFKAIIADQSKEGASAPITYQLSDDSVLTFDIHGVSRTTNYIVETKIVSQTPLPGADAIKATVAAASSSDPHPVYETHRHIVGYNQDAGVTFEEVTRYTTDVSSLLSLIEKIGTATASSIAAMNAGVIDAAIQKAADTYISDLSETYKHRMELMRQNPGLSGSDSSSITMMNVGLFKPADLAAMAADLKDGAKKASVDAEDAGAAASPAPKT